MQPSVHVHTSTHVNTDTEHGKSEDAVKVLQHLRVLVPLMLTQTQNSFSLA
jgi:hypothetical protein